MRRLASLLLLLAVAASLAAQIAAATSARATLAGDTEPILQKWLSQLRYQPRGTINIHRVAAPTDGSAPADAWRGPDGAMNIDFAPGMDKWTFYHELGHADDQLNLSDHLRRQITNITRDARPWGDEGAGQNGHPNPPREQYADLYAMLGMHPRVARDRRAFQRLVNYQQGVGKGGGDAYNSLGRPVRRVDVGHGLRVDFGQLAAIADAIGSASR
jgi:hypothetical protein